MFSRDYDVVLKLGYVSLEILHVLPHFYRRVMRRIVAGNEEVSL